MSNVNQDSSVYFWTTADVERLAGDVGNHFFDAGSMRFFGSRVGADVYGGRFFVTSECGGRDIWGGARRYSVRCVTYMDGVMVIDTVGEFGEFATRAQAHSDAKRRGLFHDTKSAHYAAAVSA